MIATEYASNIFKIRGHDVVIIPPRAMSLTIHCPFPRSDSPSLAQQGFVLDATKNVINYMIQEQFLPPGGGVDVMVLTEHP